jgi:uncharacterized phage-associated protein
MTHVRDVASLIEMKMGPLSAYKLQKLVYYAQAWSLAWDGEALFPQVMKAWVDGPVSPELWHDHKNGKAGDPSALSKKQVETVSAVLDFYGALNAQQLIDLSHRETPWRSARVGLAPTEKGQAKITNDSMRAYYAPLAAHGGAEKRIPDAVRRGVALVLSVPDNSVEDLSVVDGVTGERMMSWLENGGADPWNE